MNLKYKHYKNKLIIILEDWNNKKEDILLSNKTIKQ